MWEQYVTGLTKITKKKRESFKLAKKKITFEIIITKFYRQRY